MEARYCCSKCGTEKGEGEFPHAKGKRHSWCRDCHKAANKEWRKKYREANPRKTRIAEDYLTGDGRMICSHCHVAKDLDQYRNGKPGWCRECRAELERKRRLEKGIQPKAYSRIEGDKKLCMHCKEMKPLSDFNPAKRGLGGVAAYCKPCAKDRYYDKEVARETTAKYREVNRERHLALHRVRMHERRTKKKVTSDGTVTDAFLKTLYAQSKCHYCGNETEKDQRTADHRIPLGKGGPHSASNLVMACWTCNSSKRDLSEEEFLERMKNGSKCKSD